MTRDVKCKQCGSRMWDDEDGTLYCPSCGWEAGTPVEDEDGKQNEDPWDAA